MKSGLKHILVLSFALQTLFASAQREVYDINRCWQFTPEWYRNAQTVDVDLPHVWSQDVRGMGGYVKICDIPKSFENRNVYIRFGGCCLKSDFFVNSKHAGSCCCGYSPFAYDLTGQLACGARNTFWLRVSNSADLGMMPLSGDFNMYGGICRDVELVVLPGTHVAIDKYATDGVYVTPQVLEDGSAEIHVDAKLCLASGDKTHAVISLLDASGSAVDSMEFDYRTGATEEKDESCVFRMVSPHLWNGTEDPYMYSVKVRLQSRTSGGADTYDEVIADFGIRTVEVDGDNRLLLNGQPYDLHGVVRYEDWPMYGNALRMSHQQKDMDMILEMGANAVRLANCPNSDQFLKLCDRNGILVWAELPFTGPQNGQTVKGFVDSEQFRENGRMQLLNMLHQQYNHPSVCFIGLYSELILRGDNPTAYVTELNELVKRNDRTRLTAASSVQDGGINSVTDIVGFNQSFGWSDGDIGDFAEWAADVRRSFPQLKVGLSAYGAGASIFQQAEMLTRPNKDSSFHPEQWQSSFHEQYWKTISSRHCFWGTFVASMFDHASSGRTDGYLKGMNDDGLVSYDRHDRKDAFYFYKANWNADDMFVHIAGLRSGNVTVSEKTVKVYSNEPTVGLFLNGELLSEISGNDGIFRWESVRFRPGVNELKAVGASGCHETVTVCFDSSKSIL